MVPSLSSLVGRFFQAPRRVSPTRVAPPTHRVQDASRMASHSAASRVGGVSGVIRGDRAIEEPTADFTDRQVGRLMNRVA